MLPSAPGARSAIAEFSWSWTQAAPQRGGSVTSPASTWPWTQRSCSLPWPRAPADRVDLLAYDRTVRASVKGRTGRQVLPALVDAMAPVESALVESDTLGLATEAMRMAPNQSLLVLLTGLDRAPVEEGLMPVLPLLTQRHNMLVASVADPRIQEMARARGTLDAVYNAAAASQAQKERQETAQRLRQYGVTVVDAAPADLAPSLADAYLTLKTSGRL